MGQLKQLLAISTLLFTQTSVATEKITLYAAASLSNALTEISKNYQINNDINISTSFASSATLAKQIAAGAPADIFISADTQWMDYLQEQHKLEPNSQRNLLSNSLVLIAPKNQNIRIRVDKSFNLSTAFTGKLCTGDPASVPVGIYAKQALQHFGWWPSLTQRIVATEDVRSALAFVERGECAIGIVYDTDAKISANVSVIGRFPANSHQQIVYPFALVTGSSMASKAFYQYLQSKKAQVVFIKYGFSVLTQ